MRYARIPTWLCMLAVAFCCAQCRNKVGKQPIHPEAGTPSTVILIFIDALRADHLGCYGYPKATSPTIDQLAADAVVFENAITQGPSTFPSFSALFTSQYTPAVIGKGPRSLPTSEPLMAEYFKQAGYATAGFVDNGWLRREYGFSRGFDLYDDQACDGTGPLLARALTWLREEPDKNHFLFFHTNDVHGPYTPPRPFDTVFVTEEALVEPAEGEGVPLSDKNHVFGMIPKYQYLRGHRNLDYYVAQYDGCIRHVDSLLGAFFDALKADNIFDTSLIVIAADHGESLTEHSYFLDHCILTDQVMKVPLIAKFPTHLGITGRFTGQVQLIDLLPTFLDYLGAEPKRPISGISLLTVLRGEMDETAPYAYCAEGIMDQWAVRSRKWKYVRKIPGSWEDQVWETCPDSKPNRDAVVEELYDLRADPHETRNLISSNKETAEKLSALIDEWLAEGILRRAQMSEGGKVELDEKTKRELRALGYTGI